MLEHPRHECMVDGDGMPDAGHQAQPDGAEQASDQPYARLDASIRLGVMSWRCLCNDLLDICGFHASALQSTSDQRLERGPVVAVHDDLSMAQPLDVFDCEIRHVIFFISAFARHYFVEVSLTARHLMTLPAVLSFSSSTSPSAVTG